MLLPLTVSTVSVALGAAIACIPQARGGALVYVRWLALVAAVAAIVGHLLPEAVEALGWQAVPAFALAFALAHLLEGSSHRRSNSGGTSTEAVIALCLLLLHRFGDGLAIGTFTSEGSEDWAVVIAIASHTVPVVEVVVAALYSARGLRVALSAALALALASGLGALSARAIPAASFANYGAWISAIVSGMLLHLCYESVRQQLRAAKATRLKSQAN